MSWSPAMSLDRPPHPQGFSGPQVSQVLQMKVLQLKRKEKKKKPQKTNEGEKEIGGEKIHTPPPQISSF